DGPLLGADGRRLGGGGFLPRHTVARRGQALAPTLRQNRAIAGPVHAREFVRDRVFFPDSLQANLWDTCGRYVVSAGLQSEKHFRAMNIQWIGRTFSTA